MEGTSAWGGYVGSAAAQEADDPPNIIEISRGNGTHRGAILRPFSALRSG
jgi:hypothetical protein